MRMDRTSRLTGLAILAMLLAAPALAAPGRTHTAHAVDETAEIVLARYDDFVFPQAFPSVQGHRLPRGTYELALVRSGDDEPVVLQMTDLRTRKGFRVEPEAIATIAGDGAAEPRTRVRLRSEAGQSSLVIQGGGVSASFPLEDLR